MHANRVARLEARQVVAKLRALKCFDDLAHEKRPSLRASARF
jgi:hypothetical protein